ncbi:MAG: A/G-specific adenine glycosylase [Candidatus Saccharimonadales bacterium]
MNKSEFQAEIHHKGIELYRDMPWRQDTRPYYIIVSELMLQQTQVDRVIPKFESFIQSFPDEHALAASTLSDVLIHWSGLGYNRRAKFLYESAKKIIDTFEGKIPDTYEELLMLPGVGPNTAGAIMAYAFNKPIVFIETNIRTVYFQHFFKDGEKVSDKELVRLVQETIDHSHPREFYWALMDYGSWLKKNGAGRLQQSKHYKKQAPLKGSIREVRGDIIRHLTNGDMTAAQLKVAVTADTRFDPALSGLLKDGLVMRTANKLHLTN